MALSNTVTENAHLVTYTAAASAVTVWGLHISELAVMVSSLAATCGAVIQVLSYLDRRRASRRDVETEHDGETDGDAAA